MSYRHRDSRRNHAKKAPPKYFPKGNRPSHVTVVPRENEHPEKAIKIFTRKVKKSGIADEYRKKRYYEKPSVKRRREKKRREAVLRKLSEKQVK